MQPCFSCFCGWPRQRSPCGCDGGCGAIGSSSTSGTIAQTSAGTVACGALVWHCRAAVGGCSSSQQELWPYPFSSPLFIISAVAVCSRLQQEKDRIHMRHMSIVTAAASVKLQPHPSSLLFPLHPPHYLLQTVLPGKGGKCNLACSWRVCLRGESRVMVGIDCWFRG